MVGTKQPTRKEGRGPRIPVKACSKKPREGKRLHILKHPRVRRFTPSVVTLKKIRKA